VVKIARKLTEITMKIANSGTIGFFPSVTMNNVPFRTEVNISTQCDTEITPIKERKRICGMAEELKRYISFVFMGAVVMHTAISCVYFIGQTQSRAVFCMHVFAWI